MTLHCIIGSGARPTGDELREELSGNLCRCTGYQSILDGAEAAIRAAGPPPASASGEVAADA
jgi:carbon-monoxide dehydrogenase small subunit